MNFSKRVDWLEVEGRLKHLHFLQNMFNFFFLFSYSHVSNPHANTYILKHCHINIYVYFFIPIYIYIYAFILGF